MIPHHTDPESSRSDVQPLPGADLVQLVQKLFLHCPSKIVCKLSTSREDDPLHGPEVPQTQEEQQAEGSIGISFHRLHLLTAAIGDGKRKAGCTDQSLSIQTATFYRQPYPQAGRPPAFRSVRSWRRCISARSKWCSKAIPGTTRNLTVPFSSRMLDASGLTVTKPWTVEAEAYSVLFGCARWRVECSAQVYIMLSARYPAR